MFKLSNKWIIILVDNSSTINKIAEKKKHDKLNLNITLIILEQLLSYIIRIVFKTYEWIW